VVLSGDGAHGVEHIRGREGRSRHHADAPHHSGALLVVDGRQALAPQGGVAAVVAGASQQPGAVGGGGAGGPLEAAGAVHLEVLDVSGGGLAGGVHGRHVCGDEGRGSGWAGRSEGCDDSWVGKQQLLVCQGDRWRKGGEKGWERPYMGPQRMVEQS